MTMLPDGNTDGNCNPSHNGSSLTLEHVTTEFVLLKAKGHQSNLLRCHKHPLDLNYSEAVWF